MPRLRVATFNVENFDDRPGEEPTLAERVAVLRPQLLRLQADILCLQEVNAQEITKHKRVMSALRFLLAETPYASFHAATSEFLPGHGPSNRHNLVTLSRFPIAETRCIRHGIVEPPLHKLLTADPLPSAPSPIEWDRPVLYTTIELPGGRILHVINLHLKAPLASVVPGQRDGPYVWKHVAGWAEGFFLAAVKRAGQAFEVRLLVDKIFDDDPSALLVLAGDLNAGISEMPARLLMASVEDTGNGHLAGRALVAVERSLPEGQRFSVIHAGARVMLDHLLISKPLYGHYKHVEVHNEALGDELVAYATVKASPESYHAPLVAEFDLGA